MTNNDRDGERGRYQINRGARASSNTPYDVFVSRLLRPADEFKRNLIFQGMSARRADQVVSSVPCFVKRGVSIDIANRYKQAFESAGAWATVLIRDEPMVDRVASEADKHTGWSQVELAEPAPRPATSRSFVLPAPALELEDAPVDGFDLDPFSAARGRGRLAQGSGTTPTPVPTPGAVDESLELEPAPAPPSSKYSLRGARELEKPSFTLSLPPRPPEKPWLVRNRAKLIFGGLFVFIATYCYGCSQVMSKSVSFRSNIGDVNRRLENVNAKGQVVTAAEVVYQVRMIGHENGVKISENDVEVSAEPLGQVELGNGHCKMVNVPFETIQKLPQAEIDFIMKSPSSCMVPDAIITIKISATARWGFNSRDIDIDRYTWVARYDFDE